MVWQENKTQTTNRPRSGTQEEYAEIDVLLQHVAALAAEYSYQPPRLAVRKHRAKNTPASASETTPESALGSTVKRVRPTAQATWDDRHIAALECYAAESAAEIISNQSGRSQNEATLAFLEARYNQDIVMRLLSYQIDRRKLHLKIRQNEDNMKLLPQQHADDVRLRQAEVEMRRMEMVAVLEERRANAAYQASQLELIKGLIE
ncbi:hypothetical protein HPB51_007788 [Rhipicephalus microplus]|uniref:Uncharacterized protein n=1 Tax=Rhipicephalus microplus TaxID=6941 RepID=A0A9J6EZK2_RHIMP|nr:hypothetical protein HPB51_007788 [Rhipicephalus microplus]